MPEVELKRLAEIYEKENLVDKSVCNASKIRGSNSNFKACSISS